MTSGSCGGPAGTTIAAIADRAGVTRLTVYRHFPDDATLFDACSAHWIARQQLPDPGAWSQIGDPAARLRAGLADLYRFYRAGAGMLTHISRDFAALPAGHQQTLRDQDTLSADVPSQHAGGTVRSHSRPVPTTPNVPALHLMPIQRVVEKPWYFTRSPAIKSRSNSSSAGRTCHPAPLQAGNDLASLRSERDTRANVRKPASGGMEPGDDTVTAKPVATARRGNH
jgi:Bacterial regulatory proteins, tetR family